MTTNRTGKKSAADVSEAKRFGHDAFGYDLLLAIGKMAGALIAISTVVAAMWYAVWDNLLLEKIAGGTAVKLKEDQQFMSDLKGVSPTPIRLTTAGTGIETDGAGGADKRFYTAEKCVPGTVSAAIIGSGQAGICACLTGEGLVGKDKLGHGWYCFD